MYKKTPNKLSIQAKSATSGIDLLVNGKNFPITYQTSAIWQALSPQKRAMLADNIALASTYYLPQIFGLKEVHYRNSRPLAECFLYKNGIYDVTYCAEVDEKSSLDYLRNFFNIRHLFADEKIKLPKINSRRFTGRRAVVPFSFGKESLLNFALCKELGIEPILVTISNPVFRYENDHKKKLIRSFEREHKTKVHVIDYSPGLTKHGKAWGLKTELGWGLHVTEYSMLAYPFVEKFGADYVLVGNEQSCNDIYYNDEDVLIYRAGFDQHKDWLAQQSLLMSMLSGRRIEVISLLEPLYEISETKILHTRYPEIGKYQMSCFASHPNAKTKRWCESCEKCAYMYVLLEAFGIDTKQVGFESDLLDREHSYLFDDFFKRGEKSHFYGSQGELGLGFYYAHLLGVSGFTMRRFEKTLLPKIKKFRPKIEAEYMGIHPGAHIPERHRKALLRIFKSYL